MNEKQLRALTNTIQLYNTGQLDLNDDQLRDLKQIADAAGIAFSPETSGSRAALGFVNNLAFGIPGAVAGAFGSEMFDPITSTEEAAGSVGSLLSFLVGGGIAGKAIGGAAVRGLSGKKARDLAVRGAAALRSTGLPGGRALYGGQQRVSSAIANSPALQEAIRSGAGFGAVGGLEGLMSEDGSLLGGAMSGATLGALGSLGLGALRRGKSAATAAGSSSTAAGSSASAAERERARRAIEELRRQEAMESMASPPPLPPRPPSREMRAEMDRQFFRNNFGRPKKSEREYSSPRLGGPFSKEDIAWLKYNQRSGGVLGEDAFDEVRRLSELSAADLLGL